MHKTTYSDNMTHFKSITLCAGISVKRKQLSTNCASKIINLLIYLSLPKVWFWLSTWERRHSIKVDQLCHLNLLICDLTHVDLSVINVYIIFLSLD